MFHCCFLGVKWSFCCVPHEDSGHGIWSTQGIVLPAQPQLLDPQEQARCQRHFCAWDQMLSAQGMCRYFESGAWAPDIRAWTFTRAIELEFGWSNAWLGDSKVVILLKVTFDHLSRDEYENIRQLRGNLHYFYETVQDPTTLVDYIGKGMVQGIGSFPRVFFSRR